MWAVDMSSTKLSTGQCCDGRCVVDLPTIAANTFLTQLMTTSCTVYQWRMLQLGYQPYTIITLQCHSYNNYISHYIMWFMWILTLTGMLCAVTTWMELQSGSYGYKTSSQEDVWSSVHYSILMNRRPHVFL